ncbi:hypothetical protein [Cytobacillus kochii]
MRKTVEISHASTIDMVAILRSIASINHQHGSNLDHWHTTETMAYVNVA